MHCVYGACKRRYNKGTFMYETVKQEMQRLYGRKAFLPDQLLKKMIFFDSRTLDSGRRGREEGLQKFVAEKLMSIGANRVDVFEPDNEAIKDLSRLSSQPPLQEPAECRRRVSW